jgi:hypothetical protein
MPTATAGVQSSIDVQSSPVLADTNMTSMPHTWSWIWFVIAILVVLGFHVRVFGHPVPPAPNFP